jgi:hypothetical protein
LLVSDYAPELPGSRSGQSLGMPVCDAGACRSMRRPSREPVGLIMNFQRQAAAR